MNAWALHHSADDPAVARWGVSAAIVVAVHLALIALGVTWYTHSPPGGVAIPAILVDLAPAQSSAAPETQPLDLAPGPEMQQADAPPPPPEPDKQEPVEQEVAPTPPQENPVVAAPPEQKVQPPPPKPEPVKPKPVHTEVKKPSDLPPAPRTTAAPKAERQAALATAATVGAAAAAAAAASYNQLVAAHLQRFKQYPADAKAAGQQGTAQLSFSLGRGGQVLSSRIAGSSGYTALDGETLAMVRRAQPFPPIPPEMKQATVSFTVPIRFSVR